MEILPPFHAQAEYISVLKIHWKCHSEQWGKNTNHPLPLGMWTPT